jgi:cbb3-type cytochrome oxidase subunit 3
VKGIALLIDALCMAGLAMAAIALFALSIPLIPYFAWNYWREERATRREAERQYSLSRK